MSPQPSLKTVKSLPTLPCGNVDDSPSPSNGDYIFKADPTEDDSKPLVSGKSDAVENRIWFKTNVGASDIPRGTRGFLLRND